MEIAFLGLGKMGAPMARHLAAAGHTLTLWNRTPERARSLAAETGARAALTPAEAVRACQVLVTMLFDDAACEAVLFGPSGALDALPAGALHIASSTISERLTAEHARRGHQFVAAPVFGRPNVAEAARLWIVAAGAREALDRARPLLERLSRGISIAGSEPRQAHALKLGGNFLIAAMIHALGESFVYSQSQGIDPGVFLETVNSALFQSPFYAAYGNVMLHPPAEPGATLELGAKDLSLLREAAAARNTTLSFADSLAELYANAIASGHAQEDWAAGQYALAQKRCKH